MTFSTALKDLYGEDYYLKIKIGYEYWFCFPESSDVYQEVLRHEKEKMKSPFWTKIRITFIRSGVYFYNIPEYSYISEKFFPKDSYMSMYLEPATLDLNKENFKIDVPDEFVKMGNPKMIWYTSKDFDTTHTKVIDRDE